MRVTILILSFFFSLAAYAQDQYQIDSLQAKLKMHNAKKLELGKNAPAMFDSTAANILYELSKANWYGQPDKAIAFADRSKEISETIGYKKGVGFALYSIGVSYVWKPDFESAMEYTAKALKFGQAISDNKLIASAYTNMGVVSNHKSNYAEAIKWHLTALKIAEGIGDQQICQWNYGGIADSYERIGNSNEALKYYHACLKIAIKSGDKSSIANVYSAIGNSYAGLKKYSDAISNQKKALEILENVDDEYAKSACNHNLGLSYSLQGNYNEALKYFHKGLLVCEKLKDTISLAYGNNGIGEVYLKKKDYLKAIEYLNSGLKIAKNIGSIELMKYNYQSLSDVYNELAVSPLTPVNNKIDYSFKAFENYKLYIINRDSMVNIESAKKITQIEMQYAFDKKEAATKAEQDKKQVLAAAEIQKQKLVRNFSFAGIFAILLIGSYGFYRFQKNKQLENQQSLLAERLRISRELHDDMGSTLSSISVYSEVAKNRAAKNANETEVLQKIGTASRELIEKMSDIVWSLNPNNENFEQLKNRMMAFAAMMLTPKGIVFEFDIDDEVKSTSIAPEQRKNIFLIYKEAINNIVKYSEAKEVKVKMNVKENRLSLAIVDNGIGFNSLSFGEGRGEAYNGNGLKNMKARAEEIKGELHIGSNSTLGTIIELSLNV